VIAGEPGSRDTNELLGAIRGRFTPNKVVLLRPPGDTGEAIALAPWIEHHVQVDGRAAAYVCRDHECMLPITDPARLARELAASAQSAP
jgi:uncharacterized protein YyaL (SSP411 family)